MLIQYEKYEDINLFIKVLLKKHICLIDITTCLSTYSSFFKPFSFILFTKIAHHLILYFIYMSIGCLFINFYILYLIIKMYI